MLSSKSASSLTMSCDLSQILLFWTPSHNQNMWLLFFCIFSWTHLVTHSCKINSETIVFIWCWMHDSILNQAIINWTNSFRFASPSYIVALLCFFLPPELNQNFLLHLLIANDLPENRDMNSATSLSLRWRPNRFFNVCSLPGKNRQANGRKSQRK